MSTNRQPRDRQKALKAHLQRVYAFLEVASILYAAHALKVHISYSKPGKSKIGGIPSISVEPGFDCFERWIAQKIDIVCGGCYGVGGELTYRQNITRVICNNAYLMSRPLKGREYAIPRGLIGPVRFNAFGEVLNACHVEWILAICRANPRATFSLITKRTDLFPMRRPRNLILIRSHYRIGDQTIDPRADKTYVVQYGPATEEQMRDENNSPCGDACYACVAHGINCYSKKGPRRILRPFQKPPKQG